MPLAFPVADFFGRLADLSASETVLDGEPVLHVQGTLGGTRRMAVILERDTGTILRLVNAGPPGTAAAHPVGAELTLHYDRTSLPGGGAR